MLHRLRAVEFLDTEGNLCEPALAARIRKVSCAMIETTCELLARTTVPIPLPDAFKRPAHPRSADTITNRTGEVQTLFVDHRAAEPRASNPYTLVAGRELLDPRFPSPVVYRLSVPVGADRAPAAVVLREARDIHESAPITTLTKEEISKLQRVGLMSAAVVADVERVLARVEALKRAEAALKAICARLPRVDATKHSVDVSAIVDAVEALDAVIIKHLPV